MCLLCTWQIVRLDLDEVHRMWLVGHKMLHTVLYKAAPSIFSEPGMRPVVVGSVPYRGFTQSIYQDRFRLFLHCQLQHVHPAFNKNQQGPNNKSCGAGPAGASSGAAI